MLGLQVACVSAVVKELVSLTGKRRGGPRPALVVDAAKVPAKRPRVKVKCTDHAFKNALGKDCIDRWAPSQCIRGLPLSGAQVKIDNASEDVDMDARLGKAIQLPPLEYKGGSHITMLLEDGRLVNATVSQRGTWNSYVLRLGEGLALELSVATSRGSAVPVSLAGEKEHVVELNEANHVEGHFAELDVEAYQKYCGQQRDRFRYLEDSITCQKMDVETQVIYIDTAVENATRPTPDIKSLASLLLDADGERLKGQQLIFRCLMIAGPGTGMMRKDGISDVSFASLPLSVILDGIDEASDVKGVLQSYIMRRLVPMHISLVLTSRPEGVSADLGTLRQSFAIMSLKPLSDEQQKQIIFNQVKNEGNKFFEKLMKFAETWTCLQESGAPCFAKEIRARHDKIYFNDAFANPKDRRYMEKQLPAVNRFKKLSCRCAEPIGEKFPGTEAFKSGPSLAGKLYELAEKKKEKKHRELWSKAWHSRAFHRAFHLQHLLRLGTLETESHAHDYYDFFRRELANQYGKEMEASISACLNFMLEERMQLFKEQGKRIFTQKDVETALAGKSDLLSVWTQFVQRGDLPFVKILADGEDAEYQFRFVGDVFGRYWPLTSELTDDGRAGLWNLLLGAQNLILVSFLRPQVEGHRPYEKVQSDSFPVHWNGAGRALDLATTPGRIGLQLKINSKNSLIHFQELAKGQPHSVPEHLAYQRRAYEIGSFGGLHDLVVPSAGKRRAREQVFPSWKAEEEYWHFDRADDLLLADGKSAGLCGGDVLRHYGRVDKVVLWFSCHGREKDTQKFASHKEKRIEKSNLPKLQSKVRMRSRMQNRMQRLQLPKNKEQMRKKKSRLGVAALKSSGFPPPAKAPTYPLPLSFDFVARRENADWKFYSDTGGNAEKFRGFDTEEALLELKSLWSKAWKEKGH
eukprot:Skav202099  [mRNA]  locus=scaffold1980:24708:37417:+ [translate_table: standard]